MSYPFKNGQQSVVLRFKLLDSSSIVGAGKTGLSSASSGLIISTIADNEASATPYTQAGGTIETISTLGTFATPTATKCRFKEVDATNHPGVYEFQFDNARFAVSNAKSLLISVSGVTNLAQADYVVPLVSDDPYVAKPSNYASLVIDGSGRVDVSKIEGSDATDQIRDSVVNDATRFAGANIDAAISTRTKPADTQAAVTLVTTTTNVTNDVGITQAGADKVWSSAARTLTSFGTLIADIWSNATRTLTAFAFTVTLTDISATIANKLADHIHRRNNANIEVSADGDALDKHSPYGAIARLSNKNGRTAATTVTTYKADDATPFFTSTIVTDAAQLPAKSIDPN